MSGAAGIAEFFRKQSEEERGHAEMFMKYQVRHMSVFRPYPFAYTHRVRPSWTSHVFCACQGAVLRAPVLSMTPPWQAQNRRGGRVQLATITAPQSEYDNEEKGEVKAVFDPSPSEQPTGPHDVMRQQWHQQWAYARCMAAHCAHMAWQSAQYCLADGMLSRRAPCCDVASLHVSLP